MDAAEQRRARDRFAQEVSRPQSEIDVARAALWIAVEADPTVDVDVYLQAIDRLAADARPAVLAAAGGRRQVDVLGDILFRELGFRGNDDDYYDPRNSFLNDVIDRRRGIPITLSILYVEVARRLGLEAHGIGFPGHFLCKVVADEEIVVDAFRGQVVDRAACESLLRNALGEQARFDPKHLEAARPKQIVARLLTNLKQIYLRTNQLEKVLGCSDRLLLLDPEAPLELRDRGLVYRELECFGPALDDLERFLALAPRHESAVNVRRLLDSVRDRATHIH